MSVHEAIMWVGAQKKKGERSAILSNFVKTKREELKGYEGGETDPNSVVKVLCKYIDLLRY